MFQKILTILIYSLVFLIPIFWLPFSVEGFEFNKSYLLIFLVSVGLLIWLAKMIFKEKKIYFKRTPLDLFILLFLVVSFLTIIFSVDRIASIFGFYGRFWPSFIGILCLAGFYFLINNNIENKDQKPEIKGKDQEPEIDDKEKLESDDSKSAKDRVRNLLSVPSLSILSLLKIFLSSSVLVVLFAYLFLSKILPAKFLNFGTQSFEGLAMFLVIVFVFLLAFLAFAREKNIWLYLLLFAIFPLLALIDFFPAWLVLTLSLFLFLVFVFWKRVFRKDINRLNLVVIFLIISFVFLFFNPLKDFFQKIPQLNNLPKENFLSQKTSWTIAAQGLLSENMIFGSGNGTFSYLFNRYKPEGFLDTALWQTRFDRAGSHLAEITGTTGALGVLSYLILIGAFLLFSWIVLDARIKKSQTIAGGNCLREINLQFPLLMGFVACLLAQFVYYQNIILAFLFWFFLILSVLSWNLTQKKNVFDFKEFPEVKLVFTTLFWLILIAAVFFYFTMAKYYLADVYYKDYLQKPQERLNKLEQAAGLNNLEPQYQTSLARAYFESAVAEFNKVPSDNQLVIKQIDAAIKSGQQAIKSAPNRIVSHEILGVIYSQIRGVFQGALEWGIKSFEDGLRIEPKNPILLTELGKLKMQENKEQEAKSLFEKAVKLKKDYPEAVMQLAFLEEKQDKKDVARQLLEELVAQNPYLVEAQFHLGRLYYNQGEDDKAFVQFQNAIAIFPNHSNSFYALGLIYEKRGEKEGALKEFEKVLELNPGNKEVEEKIRSLKSK